MDNQLKLQCKKHLHWEVIDGGDTQICKDCGYVERGLWAKIDKKLGYSKSALQKGITLERLVTQNNGFYLQGCVRGVSSCDIDSMGSYED